MIQRPNITETIAPKDQAAVADAVCTALRKNSPIYPIGNGTCLEYGWPPLQAGIALSLANLNRVIDHAADDMTITVEAGMTIDALNQRLAAHRQWLPVDVPHSDRATVGGAIATDASGPRRYAYGTMRDYLLGFTAVDGQGRLFSGGGRVVKNVAGYNLCRMMAGSRGTLGILTQATLMVRPLPEAAALLACEVPTLDEAEKLLAQLVRLPVQPVAVELSAGRSPEGNPLFGPILEGHAARLCVGFEGAADEVDWMLGQLREGWKTLGVTSIVLMPNLTTDRLWRWLAALPADILINVLPSRLVGLIADVLRIAPDGAMQARAGNGSVAVKLSGEDNSIEPRHCDAIPLIRGMVAAAEGRMSIGHRSCGNGSHESDEAQLPPDLRIRRAIKERFDPHNILNPGQCCGEQHASSPAFCVSRPVQQNNI